ncbi:MAG: ABC transporter ATP-binding protein [Phycisphaeraceae bacterium]|nr:ABC transporter ATP-binding protein [Phycisphaeraceae bacterium]MCW5754155.1 ABC transporter ATP-binding protein [Phycisphaeraceae bacterium]
MAQAPAPQRARSTSSAPVVAARGLTKTFRDFWMRPRARAVDNLTFEISPRQVFGLLGPNGSGKSTTIKMILGLLRPTAGQLAIFGRPPNDVDIKGRIGYLPEESYLYGFLNARETLDYYGKLFGLPRRERQRRIEELLDMVGLRAAQFRPVREYSKGMQRRIGIAQALINDPDFLILDEPTTGLDPIGTRQVKDLIIELGRRGKTILLSSHLLADVEDCVDRMIILYGGQKRDEGTCDDLLTKQSRTTIETDQLDDGTIAEIDAVIRRRTGGRQAILSVAHPRQTLEEKFLEIVRRAKEERLQTSGATNDGEVASFLKAGAEADLIESLVRVDDEPMPPPSAPESAAPAPSVIETLLDTEPEAEEPRPAAPAAGAPIKTDEVDLSIIDALVDRPDGSSPPEQRP